MSVCGCCLSPKYWTIIYRQIESCLMIISTCLPVWHVTFHWDVTIAMRTKTLQFIYRYLFFFLYRHTRLQICNFMKDHYKKWFARGFSRALTVSSFQLNLWYFFYQLFGKSSSTSAGTSKHKLAHIVPLICSLRIRRRLIWNNYHHTRPTVSDNFSHPFSSFHLDYLLSFIMLLFSLNRPQDWDDQRGTYHRPILFSHEHYQ